MTPWYTDEYPSARMAQLGAEVVQGVAAEEIVAGLIVAFDNGLYRLATHVDGQFAGMAIRSRVAAGGRLDILPNGVVEMPDWTAVVGTPLLIPGARYFLSTSGRMDTTPPGMGYLIEVGNATSAIELNATFPLKINLGS